MTTNQLHLFVIFLISGILVGLVFDFFRILRKSFKHPDIVIYIQDVLFWIITGIILLYLSFLFNDGEIRIFMILGSILGFFIYMFTVSKMIIKISVYIILKIKKIIYSILKTILIPIKYLIKIIRKIFSKPFTFLVINVKKSIKSIHLSKNKKIKNKEKIKEGF